MNFAIIGFGGLGKVHFRNLTEISKRVEDVKLVAICDIDERAFRTKTRINLENHEGGYDLADYHLYTDVEELFQKEQLDFVITALPTYLHAGIAVMAMERGIHVFSEKPMALNAEQALLMLRAAKENRRKLMIGQCVRYFPEYVKLKEYVDSKQFGKVIRADFFRISPTIKWSSNDWMLDETQSGGAILDLHVHDVDFIQWVFGMPQAVSAVTTNYKSKHESVSTVYQYDNMLITATAEWSLPTGFKFSAGFTVRFEKATVVKNAEGFKVYPEEGEPYFLEVPAANGYVEEVVDFIHCIKENKESDINPPEDSLRSLEIALAEKVAADTGKMVLL